MDSWLNKIFKGSNNQIILGYTEINKSSYSKSYYELNKEEISRKHKEYYYKNREHLVSAKKNNPKVKEYAKIYYQKNRHKFLESEERRKYKRLFNKVIKELKNWCI